MTRKIALAIAYLLLLLLITGCGNMKYRALTILLRNISVVLSGQIMEALKERIAQCVRTSRNPTVSPRTK